jgi:2-C-methyl-D-erythritol 4-phosphate cytidylyltransferase
MISADMPLTRAALVIVAAGKGERYGASPKVLENAAGKPLVWWSIEAGARSACVTEIIVVVGEHTAAPIEDLVVGGSWPLSVQCTMGGSRRQDSVALGVARCGGSCDVILVHDAARPLVTPDLFDACARAASTHGAAIVAAPVTDTLKRAADGTILETVPRDALWGAQTPQGFRRELLVDTIAKAAASGDSFTDEASMLEACGIPVRIVPGPRTNIKVTHREDLDVVRALLEHRVAKVAS